MSERPAFQFYPADWLRNANLRRCSHAARGAWMDVLCLLHDADEYGVVRWPLAEIAQASGAPLELLTELVTKGVLKGADQGAQPYVYRAKHAGKLGEPVTLVEPGDGPCWYSSRFVRDEHIRKNRGVASRFTAGNQPTRQPPTEPTGQPTRRVGDGRGDGEGDGASIALASALALRSVGEASTSSKDQEQKHASSKDAAGKRGARLPADWTPSAALVAHMAKKCPRVDQSAELESFRDHWTAKPGKDACKLDWDATYRNWIRTAAKRLPRDVGRPLSAPERVEANIRKNGAHDEPFSLEPLPAIEGEYRRV